MKTTTGKQIIENNNNNERDDKKIILKSKDGKTFEVKRSHFMMCGMLKGILEATRDDDDDDENSSITVPISNVESHVLEKVIKYCDHHWNNLAKPIKKPLKESFDSVVTAWDNSYINVEPSLIIELTMAANYLDIKGLLNLTCAKIAMIMKNKTTEQLREIFGIENDFTPEEEAEIKKEIEWCENA